MLRTALALMLMSSCAHMTEPVSPAPNLMAAILAQLDEPKTPAECTGTIKLQDEIGDPADFVAALKACEDRAVVVEINSPGGSVFGALEIQKAIERHPHPVVCLVDGLAASAAFVTLQSCDLRMMTDRSLLMAHEASMGAQGPKERHENAAEALKALDRGMVLHCSKRMGMKPEDFEKRITDGREWWLGVEEALSFHAVDFEGASLAEAEALAARASK